MWNHTKCFAEIEVGYVHGIVLFKNIKIPSFNLCDPIFLFVTDLPKKVLSPS